MKDFASTLTLVLTFILAANAYKLPLSNINPKEDGVLLFDGFAFEEHGKVSASVSAHVYDVDIDTSTLAAVINQTLVVSGISGYDLAAVVDRAQLLASVGLADMVPLVGFPKCSDPLDVLPATDATDIGMSLGVSSLGRCGKGDELVGRLSVNPSISTTIYRIPPTGFGVISDVDDTIKITGVNTLDIVKNTLINEATAVEGMPELYASLARSLQDPAFIYLTGTPWQFYPFVHDFIHSTYPSGPIITQNLTISDITHVLQDLIDLDTKTYKLTQLNRIHEMYPGKTFLTIGDSSANDPEVYAEMYRTYDDFIACIWVHQLEGTNTTAARFDAAFEGVPESRIRLYWDDEIESLKDVDVFGGEC